MRWSWVGLVVAVLASASASCVGTASQVPVTPESSGARASKDAPLKVALKIVAQDVEGQPLSGVVFSARSARENHASALFGVTDPSGRGQFRLPPGWYIVSARAPGHQSFVDTDVRLGRDPPATVTMTLQPGGTVSGFVVDDFGAPVVDARLAWVPEDETAPRLTAVSDKQARFNFEGVGRGRGVLIAERMGFPWIRQAFDSLPRELKVTFTAPGRLRVRAVAPDGRPMNIYDTELEQLDAREPS
ncbi:carboxypeptidase regulatory-like domain-containing protein [Corallococcus sp. CA047B]|uniref:carboxypeptidase-like regulatory domain-containing protein n=1 Tax=Corallococcus sp. CA047B TaxID=2316729 RepID=UPI000EA1CA48|nr:carboxypeptidase-like regulatory domain-containing protein [Corallococcus sp. CA047B]RKH15796.1 carboxypeptidase regulatory-like domain-containing protein [Corallococcus sp. CA047B]